VDGFFLLGARKSSRLIPRLLLMDIPFVLIGDYLPDEDTKPFCKVDIDDFARGTKCDPLSSGSRAQAHRLHFRIL
jgi:DNA-binding LacI/PurR family transcriptional regulator